MTESNSNPLRVLSFGAGAIGTYIGGSLALSGNRVVFIERPETATKITSLTLTIDGETKTIQSPVVTSSVEEALSHGPFDIALFALKSFDTGTVLKNLERHKEQLPPILCLQNGVENENLISEALGNNNVVPATITSAVGRLGLGQIVLDKFRGVGISGEHLLSQRLFAAFEQAGLNPSLIIPPAAMKWSKMLTNLVANASSAILDMPPGDLFNHPDIFKFEIAQIREALKVMKAQNIPVVNLPGTPVKAFVFASSALPLWLARPVLAKAIGGGRGDKMPSFHIDLHSGRKQSEVVFLNGAVSRFGEKFSVPTPVNNFLTSTLTALVSGEIPISRYQKNPDKFIQDFVESQI
ncbi:MAG: 2-dehydropantoate 2-reductase [Chloroflexota bacterium]